MNKPIQNLNTIHGFVIPGFELVREEFIRNFTQRGEVGAACAAYYKGEKVVDLWGGYRDPKIHAPWKEDTMVIVFSSTKGMAAMALAVAHSHGLLDYDEKVATYWPEFAQNGKAQITVRQLLSHQGGLCAIETPLDIQTLHDLDCLAGILAQQKPLVEPGAHYAYHVNTLGFYENELLHRVDPQHRSLGRFFHEEVAAPLGLEFYIGLPPEIPDERIATLAPPGPREIRASILQMPLRMILDQYIFKGSLLTRAWAQPGISTGIDHTLPENRRLEMPSKNGFGQVRSIAYAYSVFARGGKELALRPETVAALSQPAIQPKKGSYDLVLHMQVAYSLGFYKPCPAVHFGLNDRAFGSPGFGGSMGFADPELELGYAYAPNLLILGQGKDPRETALRKALYKCLVPEKAGG